MDWFINRPILSIGIFVLAFMCQACADRPGEQHSLLPTQQTQTADTTNPLQLPSPNLLQDSLPKAREALYIDADLVKTGASFNTALPNNRVEASGAAARFSPAWSNGDPAAGISFCIFSFQAPDYDRAAELRYVFSSAAPEAGKLWFALANWETNRWNLFQPSAPGKVDFGSITPFQDFGGNVLVAVVLTGNVQTDLEFLRLGPFPPLAAITATPDAGTVPLNVALDASASTAGEGTITKYEWDVDGDGTFELDGGQSSTLETQYTENGTYTARVRVTNSADLATVAATAVQAVGFWQHTLQTGANVTDFIGAIEMADGSLTAYGYNSVTGQSTNVCISRWSPTGHLIWSKDYDGGDGEIPETGARDSSGNIILAGHQFDDLNQQALVQKWSPDGELIWSKRFGGTADDIILTVLTVGEDIFVCGTTESLSDANDLFLARLNGSGELVWQRARDRGDDDYGSSMIAMSSPTLGTTGLAIISRSHGTTSQPWKLEYGLNGAFQNAMLLSTPETDMEDLHLCRRTIGGTVRYYISGWMDSEKAVFLSISEEDGTPISFIRVNDLEFLLPTGLTFTPTDSIMLVGYGLLNVGDESDGALFEFDLTDGSLESLEYLSGSATVYFRDQIYYQDGMLLPGVAKNLDATWTQASVDTDALTSEFTVANGAGIVPTWTIGDSGGDVDDTTDTAELDDASDVYKGLLVYRPLALEAE